MTNDDYRLRNITQMSKALRGAAWLRVVVVAAMVAGCWVLNGIIR